MSWLTETFRGMVHSSASQSDVASVFTPHVVRFFVVSEKKGCRNVLLTSARSSARSGALNTEHLIAPIRSCSAAQGIQGVALLTCEGPDVVGDRSRGVSTTGSAVHAPKGRAAWLQKLPVAADNFGYGFEDQARTYLARADDDALAILARRHCRYVLTTQFESMLKGHATALGLPPPDAESFGLRLHRGAVSAELFRPVIDSRSGDMVDGVFVPLLRLFEVVAGP